MTAKRRERQSDGLIVYPHKRAGEQETFIIGFVVFPTALQRVFTPERMEVLYQLFPDKEHEAYFGVKLDTEAKLGFLRRRITASTHEGVMRQVWLLREHLKTLGIGIETEVCLVQPRAVEQALGIRTPSLPGSKQP